MKSHARVVVLGGGICGASMLYELAHLGWTDAVLIEKGELTSGTTWHAAGQCPHFNGSLTFARICDHSIRLYRNLEKETGQATSWHECGGIRLARDAEELAWHQHVVAIAKQVGIEAYVVGRDEISKLHPYINVDDIVGGTYTLRDGHVDPTGATNALAKGARALGATVQRHTLATGIERRGDEWEVLTNQGNIRCEHLVLATGFFTHQVAAWLGFEVPLVNVVHQYLITEQIEELRERAGELPVIRDPVASAYLRQEQKGLLGGPYETAGIRTVSNDVPWSFNMDLLEPDLEHIEPWLEKMIERFPMFGRVGVRRTIAGFIAHTPDLVPLVGPAPGLRNVWLQCGSTTGIAQGPGCSKYLAQWLVHGAAEISMTSLDPRRFGPLHHGDWVRARTVEASSHMYDMHPPGFYYESGRPLRTSPVHDLLAAKGAVFSESMGWERPKYFARGEPERLSYRRNGSFERVAEESRAVRERVGVLDMTSFAKYEVKGPDAARFLDRIFANRLPAVGSVSLGHLLAPGGEIDAEMTITRLAGAHFYLLSAGSMQIRDLSQLLLARRSEEKVEIRDVSDEFGVLVLTGPRSRDVLAPLTRADLSSARFPWLRMQQLQAGSIPIRALRVSYAGELGWELHAPIGALRELYVSLLQAGAPFGIGDFGLYALNSLRMEKAYRGFGSELTNEVSPWEAGLDRFVALDKGEFLGREGLIRRRDRGLALRLVYLSVAAPDLDILGQEPVYRGERLIGSVTSGGFGHAVGTNLAFAYVETGSVPDHGRLEVEMIGQRYPAQVLNQAAYDPSNLRMRL